MSVLDAALATHWAMEETALRKLLEIAARENTVTPEALEAYRAKSLERAEAARVRDGVAIIEAYGPLVKRAGMFAAMSGATSYETMRRDLEAALDDRDVSAILLNVDSPGGEARAVGELAGAIYAARERKPIFAYVGGSGASAAYWLTSAASRVIVSPTAMLGSIGVQVALRDTRAAEEKMGVRTLNFISSQSPMKNADPATDAGAKALQRTVDALAEVFIADVARNRGVPVAEVLERFGKGGVEVGAAAVAAGLADATGTFEGAFAEVAAEARKKSARGGGARVRGSGAATSMESAMPNDNDTPAALTAEAVAKDHPAIAAHFTAQGVAQERKRIEGINALALPGQERAVADAIAAGTSPEAFAVAMVHAVKAAPPPQPAKVPGNPAALAAIKGDEAALTAPAAGSGAEVTEAAQVEAMVASIMGAGQ